MRNRFSLVVLLPICVLFLFPSGILAQETEFGLASYYSDDFHGRKTAYGEIYDKNKLTCAHKRHGLGTMLKITRLDNKRSVVCKVTDKGPYIKGRVVDVSKKAAERLGLIEDGVVEVKVEVVRKNAREDQPSGEISSRQPEKPIPPVSKPEDFQKDEKRIATTTPDEKKEPLKTTESTGSKEKTPTPGRLVGNDFQAYDLYQVVIMRPKSKGFGVQIISLTNYENVFRQVADLQAKSFDNILISIEKGPEKPVYKVILGPFESEASAQNYEKNLKKRYKIDGFVVNLDEINYKD